uniref:Endonuclease/exonuclease/phosphatase domain-containing protein n=1 Tax=Megaselia scalaris TaxID=36166 RepID=T1GI65_MEGSC
MYLEPTVAYTGGGVQDFRAVLIEYKADISALQEIRWTGEVPSSPTSAYTKKHGVHPDQCQSSWYDYAEFSYD